MFTFRKWLFEKGLCKPAFKTPRRKSSKTRVLLELLEERVNPSPVVCTNLMDYAPGDTAIITANNFKSGSEVIFQVSHMISAGNHGIWGTADDVVDTTANATGSGHQPWAVTDGVWWMANPGADNIAGTSDDVVAGDLDKCENGSIITSWFVNPDDSLGATFLLTATGLSQDGMAETAMTMFTDANPSAKLDQFANLNNAWINGNLGGTKATYYEGESVPYRATFNNLNTSVGHTFTISYDTTKGGKHALDYLTSFNRTVLNADPLAGISSPPSATPNNYPIPIDPNAIHQAGGVFSLYGGVITSVSTYTVSGNYSGDSTTTITITFNANVSNPVLAWGGHIAERDDWG
ncbi:hypothetical protein EBX93_17620, partial [bacterium]|nr:hypothetical protein [bacterium]